MHVNNIFVINIISGLFLLIAAVLSFTVDLVPVYVFAGAVIFTTLIFFLASRLKDLNKSLSISKSNEALFKDLVNAQPAGIYRLVQTNVDIFKPGELPPLKYQYISEQHEIITGLLNADLFAKPAHVSSMIHPEDLQGFFEQNYNAIKSKSVFKWEGRIFRDGRIRWLRIESKPRVMDEMHTLWTGIVIDISEKKELEELMDRRKIFERLLLELSSQFVNLTADKFDNILNLSIERVGKFCNIDRTYIFMWNEEQDILTNTHEWCNKGIIAQIEYLQALPCSEIPQWMKHLKTFNPINIYDVSKLSEEWKVEREILEAQDVKSLFVVPIISKQRLIGFVGFDSVRKNREWQDYEVKILMVFADLICNAFERKNAEINLIESRQMLRNILDTIKVRVFWKDLELNYLGCNQSFAYDAGFDSTEEIVGKNDHLMPWTGKAKHYQEDDKKVISSGKPLLNFEEEQTDARGKKKWLLTSKIPLRDAHGDVIGMLGTYQDITEQKQADIALKASEKKYRILTENAFDGIYLLENEQFMYVNQRFCEITGFTEEEILSNGFSMWELLTPESKIIVEQRKQARYENKEIPGIYELRIKSRAGELHDIEISTTPLGGMEKVLILGIMRDITERKNNETLRNEVAIANQTVLFKQNFLANMSHEIRTPLTGVLGMIEILSRTSLDEKQLDYVNTLKLSTENLREIINQILDFSKIEAGQIQLKLRNFSKHNMFENAKKLYSTICRKDITLETFLDPEIPELIEADEYRLGQVMNNLLSNAVKFTHKGKICIDAKPEKFLDNENILIKVSVTDTGVGIRPETMERLFQPFEQIETEDARNFDGTGLGLSICKELVTLMGGEIGVESTPGEGSTFWFTFKARKVKNVKSRKLETIKSTDENLLKDLRILFAEDKIVNQKVILILLESMGHKVTVANNGHQVLEMFEPGKFDLILMDIQMPDMDGVTATRSLRERYNKLPPIVGLSANAFEGDREKYMNHGMDDYLTKPVSSEDFEFLISKWFIEA
ncbi:MAG: PAS domain S-box protein [Bacteroidales bacterium]|nr:PAS domain S-box protein [Bacteroidales bacterium]